MATSSLSRLTVFFSHPNFSLARLNSRLKAMLKLFHSTTTTRTKGSSTIEMQWWTQPQESADVRSTGSSPDQIERAYRAIAAPQQQQPGAESTTTAAPAPPQWNDVLRQYRTTTQHSAPHTQHNAQHSAPHAMHSVQHRPDAPPPGRQPLASPVSSAAQVSPASSPYDQFRASPKDHTETTTATRYDLERPQYPTTTTRDFPLSDSLRGGYDGHAGQKVQQTVQHQPPQTPETAGTAERRVRAAEERAQHLEQEVAALQRRLSDREAATTATPATPPGVHHSLPHPQHHPTSPVYIAPQPHRDGPSGIRQATPPRPPQPPVLRGREERRGGGGGGGGVPVGRRRSQSGVRSMSGGGGGGGGGVRSRSSSMNGMRRGSGGSGGSGGGGSAQQRSHSFGGQSNGGGMSMQGSSRMGGPPSEHSRPKNFNYGRHLVQTGNIENLYSSAWADSLRVCSFSGAREGLP